MFTNTVDLHIHTTASDGASDPSQLIDEAKNAGLKTISLTDHESIEGLLSLGDSLSTGIHIIPGVEFVTFYQNREIHLLGYFFDMACASFTDRIKELRGERNKSYLESVDKFNQLGFKIPSSNFIDIAEQGISLGKNHIIMALADKGYIKTWEEVIDILRRYLTPGGLAYPNFNKHSFFEAVELIIQSRGIPILAHPGLIGDDNLVLELLARNQVGLEVYYHYFGSKREKLIAKYESIMREKGLVATGGSDYHGSHSPDVKLGQVALPDMLVERLMRYKAKLDEDA